MKLRNTEATLWQRRLKHKRHDLETKSIPLSYKESSDTPPQHQRKKLTSCKAIDRLAFALLASILFTVPTGWYLYFQGTTSVDPPPVELSCQNTSAWTNDVLWKTSVRKPRLCPPKRGASARTWEQRNMDSQQLQQTIDYTTPCGSYCTFHTDSMTYANAVIAGWELSDRSGRGSNGCWEPIVNVQTHACSKWFDTWVTWMAERNSTASAAKIVVPQGNAKREAALASIPKKVGGRCLDHDSWNNNSFWRNSVEDPDVCYIGVPKPDPSLNLGLDHLIDSLAGWTPCGSYCVFHEDSKPGTGSEGRTLTGWSLGELEAGNAPKGCFRPITDIRSSHCSKWYDQWANWVNTTSAASS